MPTYTHNLNLEKPLGNENFQRQVMNENMDKIDAAIASRETTSGAQDKANAAESNAKAYADTKVQGITAASIGAETPSGSQTKANAARDAAISALSSHFSLQIDAADSRMSGTKKADTLCWLGQCVYANTPTSAGTVELTSVLLDTLRFCNYTLIVRLKSGNISLATDAIKIDVLKNVSGTFTSIASRLLKPNEFTNTTDYKCFYLYFEYKGTKATSNQIKVSVTLQQQAAAYEVSLDSIIVTPVAIGTGV